MFRQEIQWKSYLNFALRNIYAFINLKEGGAKPNENSSETTSLNCWIFLFGRLVRQPDVMQCQSSSISLIIVLLSVSLLSNILFFSDDFKFSNTLSVFIISSAITKKIHKMISFCVLMRFTKQWFYSCFIIAVFLASKKADIVFFTSKWSADYFFIFFLKITVYLIAIYFP